MNTSTQDIALLLSTLGIGAVLNSVVGALRDRRKLGADTTSILTTAARELVEPLRKELQTERQERSEEHRQHIEEIAYERAARQREHEQHLRELQEERNAAEALRSDLDAALGECRTLRAELGAAHGELTRLRARLDEAAGP